MSKNIQNCNKLLVISDTGMYISNSVRKAFGPVVKELEELSNEFDEITWIGFHKEKEKENTSYVEINNNKIKVIPLKAVGGKKICDKLSILLNYPLMLYIICKEIIKHNYIHSRAPSNPALISMFLSVFFKKKIFWHKYAGSWIDKASVFYEFQRKILKLIPKNNNKITINGSFSKQKNIIPFENPCIDNLDRKIGVDVTQNKNINQKIDFCFVGNLHRFKGADLFLEAFKTIKSNKVGEIHIVGDGEMLEELKIKSKDLNYKVNFLGFLPKNKIREIYSKSHAVVLPSSTEGFPKVIAEGMNFGCIPIVSDISCLSEYVNDGINGYLLNPINHEVLKDKIEILLKLDTINMKDMINGNYIFAQKFTYEYYVERIKKEILI